MKLDELIEQLKKENATLKAELACAIELKDGETYDWDLLGRAQERDAWKAEAELARVIIDELLAVDDAFLGLTHNQLKDYLALRGENQTK